MAQSMIASGIDFLLNNSEYRLIVPCVSGNHGRTTKKTHHQSERGRSLEYFMYRALQDKYAGNPRVKFIVSESYHVYLDVFGKTIRLHHGHNVQYHGGVGGITIPVRKAIAQWNRAKQADLDIFGHFHTFLDGGTFISNGSMIGWNAYGLAIKAEYESPKQTLFLWHQRYGKTIVAPILFDKER